MGLRYNSDQIKSRERQSKAQTLHGEVMEESAKYGYASEELIRVLIG